jgi:hypothetical protein
MTHSLDADLVNFDFVSQLAHDVSFGGNHESIGLIAI